MRNALIAVVVTGAFAFAFASGAVTPQPASASIGSTVCGVVGFFGSLAGKACNLATGPVGGIVKKVIGGGSTASKIERGAEFTAGLAAVAAWILAGAKKVLQVAGDAISSATSPRLRSTWFSSTYWRMTGIAALLTLPFLFAAAVQALMRGDLPLLLRASFGYLPLAALGTAIAAQITMLLLAASDEMSAIVSGAAGAHHASSLSGILSGVGGATFMGFFIGLLAAGGAAVLVIELAVREAAVYVVVLMLPLAFAAMVWPARRVWAIRSIELLVALILSKFVIVAVLTLGAGALAQIGHLGVASAFAGVALILLAVFAPWAVLRLLPLSELASAAAGSLRHEARGGMPRPNDDRRPSPSAIVEAITDSDWARALTARMGSEADALDQSSRGSGAVVGPASGANGRGGATAAGRSPTSGAAPADDTLAGVAARPDLGGSGAPGTTGANNGASTAASTTGRGASGSDPGSGASAAGERLPGLDPPWQSANGEHRSLPLYGEAWESEQDPSWNGEPPAGEDHNPLPDRQPDPGDEP